MQLKSLSVLPDCVRSFVRMKDVYPFAEAGAGCRSAA